MTPDDLVLVWMHGSDDDLEAELASWTDSRGEEQPAPPRTPITEYLSDDPPTAPAPRFEGAEFADPLATAARVSRLATANVASSDLPGQAARAGHRRHRR